jgi:hypothetical protein
MNMDQMNDLLKRLDEHLAETLQSESPEKRELFRALAPMAIEGLSPIVYQGGSAGVAASRLIFEVIGLIGKGQKSTLPSKDPTTQPTELSA